MPDQEKYLRWIFMLRLKKKKKDFPSFRGSYSMKNEFLKTW